MARLLGVSPTFHHFPLISLRIVYWFTILRIWGILQVDRNNYIWIGEECSVSPKENGAIGYKWEENGVKVSRLLGGMAIFHHFPRVSIETNGKFVFYVQNDPKYYRIGELS